MSEKKANDTMSIRAKSLKHGLAVGHHNNNIEFWGIFFGRPSAYLLLILVGGFRFVTPNLLTGISTLLVFVSSYMIAFLDPGYWICAAILLQLSVCFDCADGQLARYRKSISELGSYIDKSADFIGYFFMIASLTYVSIETTGDIYYSQLGLLALFPPVMEGYVKWLAVSECYKKEKPDFTSQNSEPVSVPWWRVVVMAFEFRESDLYMWVGISLCIGSPEWSLWLLAITQPPIMAYSVYNFGRKITARHPNDKID